MNLIALSSSGCSRTVYDTRALKKLAAELVRDCHLMRPYTWHVQYRDGSHCMTLHAIGADGRDVSTTL